MHIVVIGATGHVGTYLVPRLVARGHKVTTLSRGTREPYYPHGAWTQVERLLCDRAAEDAAGTFGRRVAALHPDAVIDMICFTRSSAEQLVQALSGQVQHLLVCGTIWVHGPSSEVPTSEMRAVRLASTA